MCKKIKEEKKKTYNTEYLRKEIHVTLTTSTSCQILSINGHLWALSSAVLCLSFSPLASFAMQCVAPSGGSIAFYTASVSHRHEFFVNILGLKSSAAHLFVPQFKTERRLFSRKWNDTQKDVISSKRKKNLSFDFKSGFAERPKCGTLKTTQSPCCSFCIPLYLLFIVVKNWM